MSLFLHEEWIGLSTLHSPFYTCVVWIVLVRRSISRCATQARKILKRLGTAFVRADKPFPLFVFGGRDAVGSVIYRRYCCPLPELNFPIIWKTVENNVRLLQLFSASVGRTLVLFVDTDGTRARQCVEPDRCGRPGKTGAQVSMYVGLFKKIMNAFKPSLSVHPTRGGGCQSV